MGSLQRKQCVFHSLRCWLPYESRQQPIKSLMPLAKSLRNVIIIVMYDTILT
jgi:hypothetical protein